jgi:hypothetical protein
MFSYSLYICILLLYIDIFSHYVYIRSDVVLIASMAVELPLRISNEKTPFHFISMDFEYMFPVYFLYFLF